MRLQAVPCDPQHVVWAVDERYDLIICLHQRRLLAQTVKVMLRIAHHLHCCLFPAVEDYGIGEVLTLVKSAKDQHLRLVNGADSGAHSWGQRRQGEYVPQPVLLLLPRGVCLLLLEALEIEELDRVHGLVALHPAESIKFVPKRAASVVLSRVVELRESFL